MRVPRTFAFVDLSGFTNYTAAYGDDAAGRLLSAFRTVVRGVASDYGVRVAKWLGDGCMLVSVEFGSAVSSVVDLEHRTAEICAPLSGRVGIASGHALLFEGDDYIGSAVNMASRLCDVAEPHQVLLPAMQIDRLPIGISANGHFEVDLRGFPGPLQVVTLAGEPRPPVDSDDDELWFRSEI